MALFCGGLAVVTGATTEALLVNAAAPPERAAEMLALAPPPPPPPGGGVVPPRVESATPKGSLRSGEEVDVVSRGQVVKRKKRSVVVVMMGRILVIFYCLALEVPGEKGKGGSYGC